MKKERIKIVYIAMLLLFISTQFAFGHKVSIFAWVEGDTVYTESKFMGGKRPQNSVIEVYDENGKKLLEGKTDDNGAFSFKAPVKAQLRVVLKAGMGHGNEWVIPADEFSQTDSESTAAQPLSSHSVQSDEEGKLNKNKDEERNTASTRMTEKELQVVIEKALDKKLHPLITKMNEMAQKDDTPSILEILSAIGYIIGLVGLGAYMNYRKKEKN